MAVSAASPSMMEHLQQYLHSTGGALFREGDYRAFAKVFAQKIDSMRGNATVIFSPTETGGSAICGPILDEFEETEVPHRYLPFLVKNREVIVPSPYNLKKTVSSVPNGDYIIVPFDDTTATGGTVYTYYGELKYYGIPDEKIWPSGIIDKTGSLTSFIDLSDKEAPRQKYYSKLKEAGHVSPIIFPEIAFVPRNDPQRPMLEQLVAENRILSYTLEQSAREWEQLNASFLEDTLFRPVDSEPSYLPTTKFVHRSRQKSMAIINNNFDPTLGGDTRTKYRFSVNGLPMLSIHPESITKNCIPSIEETATDMFLTDLALGDLSTSGRYYMEIKSGIDVNLKMLGQQLVEPARRYERTLRENWKRGRKKGIFNPDPLGRAELGTAFLEVAHPITPEVMTGNTETLLSGHFKAWGIYFLQKRPEVINRMRMSYSRGRRPCQPLTLRSLVPPQKRKQLYRG